MKVTKGNKTIKVLIADDHALIRKGLKKILEMEHDILVTGEAQDGEEAVAKTKELNPDVVLMDINMPKLNGVEATRIFKQEGLRAGVVILTIHEDPEYLFEAVKAGALGFVLKDVEPEGLIKAVRAVYQGESYIQPSMTKELLSEFCRLSEKKADKQEKTKNALTDRQLEVLKLIAQGLTNGEIADKLAISEKTVKNHVSSILRKLDVLDRTQAAIYAIKNNLI
ncbi:MAG: two-component system, NarL family, response regulator DegU [Thermosediminibacterales bacterium]|nr:two-component system, NarL family, response regulator DegU [Thermosediminibacterales bacterium]MDK2836293.1 two-component system, NarL family, response regulator DegU [Thermosediminibacterales bacterium]